MKTLKTKRISPLSTCTKTAARQFETYARRVLKHARKHYNDRAARECHGELWIANRIDARLAEIDAIRNAPELCGLTIGVEWKKSATWGLNPTATVTVRTAARHFRYTGKASGCGYDKLSAAVAEAFNQSPTLQRLLIVLAARKTLPYGARVNEFGASFSGGVGIGCFQAIFEAAGYKWNNDASGKTFDAFTVTQ